MQPRPIEVASPGRLNSKKVAKAVLLGSKIAIMPLIQQDRPILSEEELASRSSLARVSYEKTL